MKIITESLKALIPANANSTTGVQSSTALPKPPPFSFQSFRLADDTAVTDYFMRFKLALNLSKIPEEKHANYFRVYIGVELNDALKFLISPEKPEDCDFAKIKKMLEEHFDFAKNEFSERVKLCQITQKTRKPLASISL